MTPAPTADLMILDTASLYYRSYYALPSSMTAPDGFPHNAVRGLLQTITRLRQAHHPTTIIAAWDADWRPQWRVDALPEYKTHRLAEIDSTTGDSVEDEPDELSPQIGAIHTILSSWGVPVVGVRDFEADDVIGTLAPLAARNGRRVVIVTGDRDLVQLVSDDVRVLLTVKGGMEAWPLLDPSGTVERFRVRPDQYLDVAVLRGDPSDGLPGVKGIGEKTAVRLITHFGTLDAVRRACSSADITQPLTPRIASAINDAAEYLDSAYTVSIARPDVPIANAEVLVNQPIPDTPLDADVWLAAVDEWGVRRFAEDAMDPGYDA